MIVVTIVLSGCAPAEEGADDPNRGAGLEFEATANARVFRNLKYGPHTLQAIDLWIPESRQPTPLVLFIHGGGFSGGDKDALGLQLLYRWLTNGIAFASVNYRLTPEVSFPAFHEDAKRAVQFLRYHAQQFNLDAGRFAAMGGSAGAGISLWLAFKDDMAERTSEDPVARQSTRLTAVAVWNGQTSYDPFFADSIGLPRVAKMSFFLPFYGIAEDEIDSPRAHQMYREAAAITHLTEDDVPVLLDYYVANDAITDQTSDGDIIHHPKFGIALKARMDALGIAAILQYPGHPEGEQVSAFDFLVRHLGVGR